MSSIRCCLIQLYGTLQPENAEPLAIETLAGSLAEAIPGIAITLLTFGIYQSTAARKRIIARLIHEEYDVIGISCPQSTYKYALEILDAIYQHEAPPRVVVGHALPTSLPDLFLDRYPHILVVRGWGEDALVELCLQLRDKSYNPSAIPSLSYRDDTGNRHDTDIQAHRIGIPQRMNISKYFSRIEASRGCHYDVCTFCSRFPRVKKSASWKRLNKDHVLSQVRELVAANTTSFTFADEDFIGNDPASALALAEALVTVPGIDFSISVRVDNVIDRQSAVTTDPSHARVFSALQQAGLSMVYMGAESFSGTQLRRYGKGTSAQDNVAAIRELEKFDFEIELGLIMFDPLVTLEELRENVDTLLSTGYFKYVGYPLSFMRAQVNTPYALLLKTRDLRGNLVPELASYEAAYASPVIAKIAQRCLDFFDRLHPFYWALRNAQRSMPSSSYPYRKILHELRLIQVEYLECLLAHMESDADADLSGPEPWLARIERCKRDVVEALQLREDRTPLEEALIQAM